jgi:hypothetical protein
MKQASCGELLVLGQSFRVLATVLVEVAKIRDSRFAHAASSTSFLLIPSMRELSLQSGG